MSATCPFCGADYRSTGHFWEHYKCMSTKGINKEMPDFGLYNQSSDCKDRQIAQLQERLEAFRSYHAAKTHEDVNKAWQKLRDLGEI